MPIAAIGLSFVAGLLSVLSPCVLPLLPVVFAAAASEHRYGPLALAGGLTVSFTAIGLFVATVGFAIGLDGEFFRAIAATLFIVVGAVLLVPRVQTRVAVAAGPLGNWTEQHLGGFSTAGAGGQFLLGLLLGAVWIPCVGPTLGAASLLAAKGESLVSVAAVMLAFGLGAAAPLALLGLASREAVLAWRHRLMGAGKGLKVALGAVLVLTGALILSGLDRAVETALVNGSPAWLTELTTRF
jgi:cytochrome c-type biogenesis protein